MLRFQFPFKKTIGALLLCCFAMSGSRFAHAENRPVASSIGLDNATPVQQAAIQAEVERLILQFGDGLAETYSESPTVVRFGTIFEDHQHDAVVLFNLEGFGAGNYHAEFIAFFSELDALELAGKTSRPYRLVAVSKLGGRGWRTFDFNSARIQNRSLKLKGSATGPGDALCCASIPIRKVFRIDEFDHIIETNEKRNRP